MYENKDFCGVVMPFEDNKILEFNQYQKSDKIPSVTYAVVQSFVRKVDRLKIILKNYLSIKVGENIRAFNGIENKHDVSRGEDCMKEVLWMFKIACNRNS